MNESDTTAHKCKNKKNLPFMITWSST